MNNPSIPARDFKRTKIIATIGPSTNTYEYIKEMIESGANGIRLNFSHGDHAEREEQIKWIRKASRELKKPVAIIQDLQGPKIRVGDFDEIINIEKNQSLTFKYEANYAKDGHIPMQYDLSKKARRGQAMYLYDGKIKTVVTSVAGGVVHVKAENSGVLVKRKGMNLPDTDFSGDIITEKDKRDIAWGSTKDIDYVALSFVQTADDITQLRTRLKNLGSDAKIIAKIESKKAIDELQAITEVSDVVMVARGDLAVETSPESVPITQRKIIDLCKKYAKPSIVATQLLFSMTDKPEPTRAEVSDIATAVMLGADCVMLSDETAAGKFPIEAIKIMKRVVNYTQSYENWPMWKENAGSTDRNQAIPRAAINLARELKAVAIVAETMTGGTALRIAANRPDFPIIAATNSERVAQQLAIVYGTKSFVRPDDKLQANKLADWLFNNKVLRKGDTIVSATGRHPGVAGTTDTIKVRVLS